MSIERGNDGSVTIRENKSVTVMGKVLIEVNKDEDNFKRWVEDCAKLVTACPHTLKEVEQCFLQNCDAIALELNDKRMKNFQHNVIMNYCEDKLEHQSSKFSFDMTDEEIEKWKKEQDVIHEEVRHSPPERFGLKMRGYYLPHTERNTDLYEQASVAHQKCASHHKHSPKQTAKMTREDICFFFEETTEHCFSTGGGENLIQQLIAFRGITAKDIEERNPRFMGYICTLRDMGELPDFH